MSTNILYTGDGRRIEFDVPDKALKTAEDLKDAGASLDIAITNAAPILGAAELRRLLKTLERNLQDAPTRNIAGLNEAKKLVQARIAELGGAQ